MAESNIISVATSTSGDAKELIAERIDSGLDVVGSSLGWMANNQALLIEYGVNIVVGIATLVIGLLLARLISGAFHKVLTKRKIDSTIVDFVAAMTRYVIIAIVVIAALSHIGVQTTSFIALIGAAGLAIGLSLQGALSNFASGVLIIVLRPFKAGEYIDAAGVSGSVESVQIFATTLTTPDNKFVVVPNSAILSGNIVNYSRKPTRRIDLIIGVSYEADLAKTKALLDRVVNANSNVLTNPEPQVAVAELADSSVNFVVRPWVKSELYWTVRFELMEAIKNGLDEEGIQIPFPQMDIHLDK
jgi:small conductance mechanosensitive channel